jgi:hypothetical protein
MEYGVCWNCYNLAGRLNIKSGVGEFNVSVCCPETSGKVELDTPMRIPEATLYYKLLTLLFLTLTFQ